MQYTSHGHKSVVTLLIIGQFFAVQAALTAKVFFFTVQCVVSSSFLQLFFLHRLKSSFFPVGHTLLSTMLSMASSNTIDVVCKITHTTSNLKQSTIRKASYTYTCSTSASQLLTITNLRMAGTQYTICLKKQCQSSFQLQV